MNKDVARDHLMDAMSRHDVAFADLEKTAAALLEAQTAQQRARQVEKDAEAALIKANPDGMFTPRKTSEAEKDAYKREMLSDTYAARALAEENLVIAQYEHALTTARKERLDARVAGLTAILNSYN